MPCTGSPVGVWEARARGLSTHPAHVQAQPPRGTQRASTFCCRCQRWGRGLDTDGVEFPTVEAWRRRPPQNGPGVVRRGVRTELRKGGPQVSLLGGGGHSAQAAGVCVPAGGFWPPAGGLGGPGDGSGLDQRRVELCLGRGAAPQSPEDGSAQSPLSEVLGVSEPTCVWSLPARSPGLPGSGLVVPLPSCHLFLSLVACLWCVGLLHSGCLSSRNLLLPLGPAQARGSRQEVGTLTSRGVSCRAVGWLCGRLLFFTC